ncbi:MAG: mannose-1-phosphate guanylyltransferase [Caulobacteraceae bacterium]
MAITPVIMSGGAGTRLWPLSRAASPKPLHALGGAEPLLAQTLGRFSTERGDDLFGPPLLICNVDHAAAVKALLGERAAGVRLVLEPVGRNTALCAAVAAALVQSQTGEDEALVLLSPADHHIGSPGPMLEAVARARTAAVDGRIVVFGLTPTAPETAYGYIRTGGELGAIREVEAFVEKPDLATAKEYLAGGKHLWNAGYFLFRADVMLAEMERLQPEIAKAARAAAILAAETPDGLLLDKDVVLTSPSISLDYAVMEHTRLAAVSPFSTDWSDLGAWDAVWGISQKDDSGNATAGDAVITDSRDCLAVSAGPAVRIYGVEHLVVVATGDAVLVAPRDQAQNVKAVVEALREAGREDLL